MLSIAKPKRPYVRRKPLPVVGLKNKIEICGDYAVMHIRRRDGREIETLIDTEDVELLKLRGGSWFARETERADIFYVSQGKYRYGQYPEIIMLHRLLAGFPPSGQVVDHINCDTLDNRRQNLRVATYSLNALNTQRLSGAVLIGDAWHARIHYQKREFHLGSYSTQDEAHAAVLGARRLAIRLEVDLTSGDEGGEG